MVGGRVLNSLKEGDLLAGGSACALDTATHEIKILRTFKVKAVSGTTSLTITVYTGNGLPDMRSGLCVMVMPATLAGTGKAVLIPTVDTSVAGEATFTVLAADIDTVTVGAYLVESDKTVTTASGAKIYCTPEYLTYESVLVENGDTLATASAVYSGMVMAKRIPYLPDVVKANIKGIVFDNI